MRVFLFEHKRYPVSAQNKKAAYRKPAQEEKFADVKEYHKCRKQKTGDAGF